MKLKPDHMQVDSDDNFALFDEVDRTVNRVLETYSNVHRGSGHYSMLTTKLYETARKIVLETLGLTKEDYTVIFSSPSRAKAITAQLRPESYVEISSQSLNLPVGIRALAIRKKDLPREVPFISGGGTARLVAPGWVVHTKAPGKFEAGTPGIINIIAMARAMQLSRKFGLESIPQPSLYEETVSEVLYEDDTKGLTGKDLLDKLRQNMTGQTVTVPTMQGPRRFINLDNAATTPAFGTVRDVALKVFRLPQTTQNGIVEEVRNIVSTFLNAPFTDYDIIFTSNTTDAINLAAESFSHTSEPGIRPVVLNTVLEHNSNELPWRNIPGASVIRLAVDEEGFIHPGELESVLEEYNNKQLHGEKRIRLVTVSGASNVLGTYNNLEETCRIVHRFGALVMTDAAQLVAHEKIDMAGTGIDCLAFSGHKAYAPFGTGVLVVPKGWLNFTPEEMSIINASGEENKVGIAAMGKAFELLQRTGMDLVRTEEKRLAKALLHGLTGISGITVYGIKEPESHNFDHRGSVIAFSFKNQMPRKIATELMVMGGIGIRTGCHCAHILVKHFLHVPPWAQQLQRLMVTLVPGMELPGIARVSPGIGNCPEDIDDFIQTLTDISLLQRNKGAFYAQDRYKTGSDLKKIKNEIETFIMKAIKEILSE